MTIPRRPSPSTAISVELRASCEVVDAADLRIRRRTCTSGSDASCWRRLPEWLRRRRSALAPANSLSLTTSLWNAKGNTRELVFCCTKVTAFSVAFSSLYSSVFTRSPDPTSPPRPRTLRRAHLKRGDVFKRAWRRTWSPPRERSTSLVLTPLQTCNQQLAMMKRKHANATNLFTSCSEHARDYNQQITP